MDVKPKRVLSLFSLVMINIIAVDSLRTLPFSAKFGAGLIFYYLLAALFFFLPVALVTSELATTWPALGGIYIWVKKAFGEKMGFLVVWLQWIYNVVWYPSILGLVAGILGFCFWPSHAEDPTITMAIVLSVYWGATLLNCFGMKLSSVLSTFCTLLGTLLPMALIIALGLWWVSLSEPLAVSFDFESMFPRIDTLNELVLLTVVLFGLMGLEMSAVHAQEVKTPETTFPKAIKISFVIILFSLMFSSLAIAVAVPPDSLNLVTGPLQAFQIFFEKLGLEWVTTSLGVAMIIGAIGSIAAWIIGPTKGLLAAANDGVLPDLFKKTNKQGVPVTILVLQACLVSLLAFAYVLLPSLESAYLILTQLTAILALMMYVLFFVAGIYLRYSHPDMARPYRIPLGNLGMWLCGLSGTVMCLLGIVLGFLPPSQIAIGHEGLYQSLLGVGVACFSLPAFWLNVRKKRNQCINHASVD